MPMVSILSSRAPVASKKLQRLPCLTSHELPYLGDGEGLGLGESFGEGEGLQPVIKHHSWVTHHTRRKSCMDRHKHQRPIDEGVAGRR